MEQDSSILAVVQLRPPYPGGTRGATALSLCTRRRHRWRGAWGTSHGRDRRRESKDTRKDAARGPKVNDQLKLRGLLDGQVAGLRTLEDLAAGAVANQQVLV